MARRIATFDKQSIADIKNLVNKASLPADQDIGAEWEGFINSVKRPAAQEKIGQLMKLGLQKNPDVENAWRITPAPSANRRSDGPRENV